MGKKIVRNIIEIDQELCNGCGLCVPKCAEGAIQIVDGKARLIGEKFCDGLGACLGECPRGALRIVKREAEEFDEAAVEELMKAKEREQAGQSLACGCPSSQVQTFQPMSPCAVANRPVVHEAATSSLTHWPVQIRLVPPTAPFLKGARLLVASDCTPIAYPRFHQDLLKGRVVLMGCPKFDDAHSYVEKFKEIFETADIKEITNVIMEVPCCSAMPAIVQKALELSGKEIPVNTVIVSTRGELLTPLPE